MDRTRSRLTYANIMSTLAVFLLLGGTAYAATSLNGDSITKHSISGNRMINNTLTGHQIDESRLGTVPNAAKLNGLDAKAFVNGDGRLLMGGRLVGDKKETLFSITGNLRVQVSTEDVGKTATITLTNLSSGNLTYATSTADDGNLAPSSSASFLIGLLSPATLTITGTPGDSAGVHVLNFTAFGEAADQVEVVGQALSGP